MADNIGTAALRARVEGRARTGTVTVRDFDQGVVETLGARIIKDGYFITELASLDPPPGLPGIPVVFSHPEEVFQTHRVPVIEVRRDDITPAMSRWHPGMGQYSAPKLGAKAVASPIPGDLRTSFDSFEDAQQSCPFDILYTISIQARQREYMAAANRILAYVLKIYQPYCAVYVKDDVGDRRSYEAFMESLAPLDEVAEVGQRMIGFAMSLRVEAELDINDPIFNTTTTQLATVRTHVKPK